MDNTFSYIEKNNIVKAKNKIIEKILLFVNEPWFVDSIGNINKIYLTGGSIASLLQGEEPKDWDFYFVESADMDLFARVVENNHKDSIADVSEKYMDMLGKNGKVITGRAIMMKNDAQFITMLYGSPEELRKNFDYVHCLPYYYRGQLHISKKQYDACVSKTLILNNQKSFKDYRQHKFINRGYKVG